MTTVPENVQQAYGPLPDGWRLEKLKFFADVRNSNVDKTVADDEEPVRLCNYTDVYYNDRITCDLEFMNGSATEAEIEKFQLKRGQVIITKDSEGWDDIGIPALVTEDMPDVLCGYHLSVLEPRNELDGGFLAWLCRSEPLNDQFKLGANGVTRYGLGQYPMKNAFVALPPLETQRRIARFLDEKTARIDGLIEKKRALLDRLAEKRQALITRAVTKGLNPDAPMKPSGIDWLGDIPAHWEVRRLKELCIDIVDCKNRTPPNVEDGEYFVVRTTCLGNGRFDPAGGYWTDEESFLEWTRKGIPQKDDVLISREAPMGEACLFPEEYKLCLGQRMMLARADPDKLDPYFLLCSIYSDFGREYVELRKKGTTVGHLRVPEVHNFPVIGPPVQEQARIAATLRAQLQSITATEEQITSSCRVLSEYRAALITAAVTGQIGELNGD